MDTDTTLVKIGIPGIGLALGALFVYATWLTGRQLGPAARRRRTLGVAVGMTAWLVVTGVLAASGVLARFDVRPPPFVITFVVTVLGTAALAWSPFGRRFAAELPFVALIGFQAFRLPLELVMHQAATAKIMPEVMTFTGYNFDIVTGVTALLLGLYAWLSKRPLPRPLIMVWNFMGQILLFVIVGVAFAATPVFRAFGDGQVNTFVAEFPYIWIAVSVAAALFGHIVTLRKLLAERRAAAAPATPAAAAAS
jgi:hypothetical protein